MPDLRESIQSALTSITNLPFRKSATDLLSTLGYRSDRTVKLGSSDPQAFLEFVQANASPAALNESKALYADWQSADLLFQLTDSELSGQKCLFNETEVRPSLLQSYLFFAIELTGDNYARGKLTDIARQINRVFPMPVMVLLKHNSQKKPVLSIAVINRRLHKRDASKDVLSKVTIIRDISLTDPHRGHLDILASFAAENLVQPKRMPINSFDALHAAWEEIFNVELLNKSFYRELANWYFWALPQVEFPADAEPDGKKRRATSLIRLLTRLIFCWFLKEKGLISDKLSGIDLSGTDAYGERNRRNEEVRGLLRILSSYKFTIVENTPIDQEFALDPELLGKVFENLLASYNEETKTTARKQTGSFYTPRPIVEYMVDESLKGHLIAALTRSGMSQDIAASGLEVLFAYTEQDHPFTDAQVDALLDAIHMCKILDPACGSGAFPMGILQKLVYIINKLDPDNTKWKQLQVKKANEIPDRSSRDVAIAAIERDFAENEDDYGRKLYLIENCLYGVDIQPIAIQISKLRFFISLVCDQRVNRRKRDNYGIQPLPNLETKFVSANTLIGLKKDEQLELFASPKMKKLEAELQQVRHDHFMPATRQRKLALEKRDSKLRSQMAMELVQTTFADQTTSRKLAKWNPYDPQQSASFFEPLWMFDRSLADGFDIVIGNPPYFKENDDKERFNGLRGLECYQGKMDVWYLFADVGLNFLKHGGVLSFIATNNWVTNAGASKIRNKILRNSQLLSLVDFQDYMIFESSSIQTMVMVLKKDDQPQTYTASISKANAGFSKVDIDDLKSGDRGNITGLETFDVIIERESNLGKPLLFKSGKNAAILDCISAQADTHLKKHEIAQGIVPNPDRINARNIKTFGRGVAEQRGIKVGDGVFVLTAEEAAVIHPDERKYLKTLYEPIHIGKYNKRCSDLKILYTKRGYFDPKESPSILSHLKRYREVMEARRENRNGRIEYFNLHWPRDESIFQLGEKILSPRKCAEPTFLYTGEAAYVMLAVNVIGFAIRHALPVGRPQFFGCVFLA